MVFKNKFYRIVAVIMGYTFIATTVLYYGISFNAAALPGNLYDTGFQGRNIILRPYLNGKNKK